MDNELLLYDRTEIIKQTILKYGEENFYISFSGGKDSTILHHLIDMAIPGNKIPRVFINTGIEYNAIVDFVKSLADNDSRFVIVKPSKPIKQMLEKYGYPFKSKDHSLKVYTYQNNGYCPGNSLEAYATGEKNYINTNNETKTLMSVCPVKLRYQFTPENKLKISNKCCFKLKKEPAHKWAKENNKTINITGMRREEGGHRSQLSCIITDKDSKLIKFHPLVKIDSEFEDWFINKFNIKLCELYYPPYNFVRTGCKGCPYALHLNEELESLEKLLPNERKQCEIIWKPVYDEYRRLNYRLKKIEKVSLLDENYSI